MIKVLKEFVSSREYKSDTDIIYKGHIPYSGFLLIDGCIELEFSKKKMIIIDDASIIGVRELMNSELFKFKVSIRSNSLEFFFLIFAGFANSFALLLTPTEECNQF